MLRRHRLSPGTTVIVLIFGTTTADRISLSGRTVLAAAASRGCGVAAASGGLDVAVWVGTDAVAIVSGTSNGTSARLRTAPGARRQLVEPDAVFAGCDPFLDRDGKMSIGAGCRRRNKAVVEIEPHRSARAGPATHMELAARLNIDRLYHRCVRKDAGAGGCDNTTVGLSGVINATVGRSLVGSSTTATLCLEVISLPSGCFDRNVRP